MWLAMLLVIAIAGGAIGAWAAMRIAAIREGSILPCVYELVPSQTVRFDAAGAYVLYVQPPQFRGPTAGTRIGLWDPAGQTCVDATTPMQKGRDAGGRFAKKVVHVPREGDYQLVIEGLDETKRPFTQRIVFGRSIAHQMMIWGFAAAGGHVACLVSIIIAAMIAAGAR